MSAFDAPLPAFGQDQPSRCELRDAARAALPFSVPLLGALIAERMRKSVRLTLASTAGPRRSNCNENVFPVLADTETL